MTITTYTDREIALRQQLAAATQLAQLNGEIAAELKADKLALEAAIEASQKQEPFVQYEGAKPMYKEAQLKQYGDHRARQALEMAAVAAWSFHMNRSERAGLSPTAYEAWSPVSTIRELAKEIK